MLKKRFLLSFLFCFFILSLSGLNAWEKVPLPNQTIQLKEEEMLINAQKINTIHCRSSLSQAEIKDFYLRFLPGLGWVEGCLECRENKEDPRLIFSRQNDKIIIFTFPPPLEKDKTDILITMSKAGETLSQEPEKDKDYPGEDPTFIPRYPASQRVSAVERDSGKKIMLAYTTRDNLNDVLDFYQENMAKYDWETVMDTDFRDLPPQLSELQKQVKLEGRALVFKGANGECTITVTKHPQEEGLTIIGVHYNAK